MMTVLRGGKLLNIAGHSADNRDLLIENGVIREIGPPGFATPEGSTVIDASDRLLMPGLINAHTHGHGSLGRGLGDRWSLELLLNAGPWMAGGRVLEDKYLSALLNAVELLKKGCTACYDLYTEIPLPSPEGMDAVGRAYRDAGMRAVIAPMMADATFFQAIPGLMEALPVDLRARVASVKLPDHEESLAAVAAALDAWSHDRDRVRLALAPTIPLHCSDAFIQAAGRMAADYDVGLHMHLGESRGQAVSGIKRYGKTLTAHLDGLGFLSPRFTGAHCVWLDPDDIARMADQGAKIAHNPGSNLRLGSGIAPAEAMRVRGVTLGIGTDGSQCSDNQNMFEAMRLASFVSRVEKPDPANWLATEQVLHMATAGSAEALGMGDLIGRIEPGYRADIVMLDLGSIGFIPFHDPVNQIVHAEDSTGVAEVMVDGELVVKDRKLVNIDEAKLRRDVETAVDRLRGANEEARAFAALLEPVVGRFCVGLANEPYHIHRHVAG
ncbi:MAG: amidohydrolase [Alphaproteobacteria bacterium]|nr:amidohydrolase [Alphaproteobacteria bacterium]